MAKDQTDPPEDPKNDPPEDPEKDQTDPPEDPEKDPADPPEDPEKGKTQDPELKRAIQRRDRALKEKQALQDQLQKLKEKYEPEKADPVKVANRRLVTAESRVVMAAAGLTEVDDQKALAPFLDLDSVGVEEDGTVDSDAIQERLETLVRVVGKLAKTGGKTTPRTPRTDPRDRGGEKATPKDAQSARRRSMLYGR